MLLKNIHIPPTAKLFSLDSKFSFYMQALQKGAGLLEIGLKTNACKQ